MFQITEDILNSVDQRVRVSSRSCSQDGERESEWERACVCVCLNDALCDIKYTLALSLMLSPVKVGRAWLWLVFRVWVVQRDLFCLSMSFHTTAGGSSTFYWRDTMNSHYSSVPKKEHKPGPNQARLLANSGDKRNVLVVFNSCTYYLNAV